MLIYVLHLTDDFVRFNLIWSRLLFILLMCKQRDAYPMQNNKRVQRARARARPATISRFSTDNTSFSDLIYVLRFAFLFLFRFASSSLRFIYFRQMHNRYRFAVYCSQASKTTVHCQLFKTMRSSVVVLSFLLVDFFCSFASLWVLPWGFYYNCVLAAGQACFREYTRTSSVASTRHSKSANVPHN